MTKSILRVSVRKPKSMREAKENYRLSNTIINSASGFGKSYRKNIHNRIGFTRSYDLGESLIHAFVGLAIL